MDGTTTVIQDAVDQQDEGAIPPDLLPPTIISPLWWIDKIRKLLIFAIPWNDIWFYLSKMYTIIIISKNNIMMVVEQNNIFVFGIFFLVVVILQRWYYHTSSRKNKQQSAKVAGMVQTGNKKRRGSLPAINTRVRFDGDAMNSSSSSRQHQTYNRQRSGSTDDLVGIFDDTEDDLMSVSGSSLKDFAIPEGNYNVLGPNITTMSYDAWSPPQSWSNASKNLVPKIRQENIKRKLTLDLSKHTLTIERDNIVAPPTPNNNSKNATSPTNTNQQQQQQLEQQEKETFVYSLFDISIHVKPPSDGGILEIYTKGTNKEEWMEYTFQSACQAAQFQQDVIGCQCIGRQIQSMYAALEIMHKGNSLVYNGEDLVLHDKQTKFTSVTEDSDENESNKDNDNNNKDELTLQQQLDLRSNVFVGVAWDDAMRCLGSTISTVRCALKEQLVLVQSSNDGLVSSINKKGGKGSKGKKGRKGSSSMEKPKKSQRPSPLIASLYSDDNKRLLLGHIDFHRLFVPPLTKSALPKTESNPERMEELILIRKITARACMLVRSYVRTHVVVNKGWVIDIPDEQQGGSSYLVKRVAFDTDDDNSSHDKKQFNEYYEPTVSRDIKFNVRSLQDIKHKGSTSSSNNVTSPYQAYSLVGSHCFKLPPPENEKDHALLHDNDPVWALPSLRHIIESNPDLQFFVAGSFSEERRSAIIDLFVRWLPTGIDLPFDNVDKRYANSNGKERDRRAEVFVQLGPGSKLSPLAWACLKFYSFYHMLTKLGESVIPIESGSPRGPRKTTMRTPFPGIKLSNFFKTNHFGGSLQRLKSMPNNYVAITMNFDEKSIHKIGARLLYSRIQNTILKSCVLDTTFVIEGHSKDELNERALASIRRVHIDDKKIALPIEYSSKAHLESGYEIAGDTPESSRSHGSNFLKDSINQAWANMRNSTTQLFSNYSHLEDIENEENHHENNQISEDSFGDLDDIANIEDEYKDGVVALCEILQGIQVLARKDYISGDEEAVASSAKIAQNQNGTKNQNNILPPSVNLEDLVYIPVLKKVNAHCLKRFYVACDGDVKKAAVRLVQTEAWRGITFPIDTRTIRIELQSGQFFQQGCDIDGNPVFYFRCMLLGPWRQDRASLVNAIFYRFERALEKYSIFKPDVKFTVVCLLGKPTTKEDKRQKGDDSSTFSSQVNISADESTIASTATGSNKTTSFLLFGTNPRVDPGEEYFPHVDVDLIHKLVNLLSKHYPERLAKALVVPGKGYSSYLGQQIVKNPLNLRSHIQDKKTRLKVKILKRFSALLQYIDRDELVAFLGGNSPVSQEAFQPN